MEVKDLTDHAPLAFDLQQMEEISEAETGDIVGVNAGAGRSSDDLDANDCALSFRRRPEVTVVESMGAGRSIAMLSSALSSHASIQSRCQRARRRSSVGQRRAP
jgi:hypothetical protein